jgi:hypothetical protein
MFLSRCPATGTGEPVLESSIAAVTNHPTHVALTVRGPHGHRPVHSTGSRWEQPHRTSPARQARELLDA